jgi:hypothetical protein
VADNFNQLDSAPGAIRKFAGSVTAGNFTSTNVGSTWTQATNFVTTGITASVGDYVVFLPTIMIDPTGATSIDVAVKVGAAFVRYASSGTGTAATDGDPGLYSDGSFLQSGVIFDFVVTADDLSSGTLTFAMVYKGTGTTTVMYASSDYPWRWRCINFGPPT